ncbi:hypothetical protein [Brevundimonas sp. Root1279]|uniref:hypothetical protein n=1 Tax=Brevundimonas sp. Root1279 TaxID=1736443 RepID=UPI0012E3EDC8|nr:hypothetical protein [Brevundimonas sp. Root1279]
MKRSEQERAIGLAMLESCGFLSLPRWPKQKALSPPDSGAPKPPRKTDGTA